MSVDQTMEELSKEVLHQKYQRKLVFLDVLIAMLAGSMMALSLIEVSFTLL